MPWKETCPMEEKLKFMAAWKSGDYTMAEICRAFAVSRKTGYKWVDRYEAEGLAGLEERSRAPHYHPNALPMDLASELLTAKQRHPRWGPRKILDWLEGKQPHTHWPVASTVGELYKRHGLVRPRRRRARAVPLSEPLRSCAAPNEVWSADFKGQFRVGRGQWCYPLTVADQYSRYLLSCRALRAPTEEQVWPWWEQVFRDYGLPLAIRTDNGAPFASTALGGLTRLVVWWLKLGIVPERIAPGHPEQNGRHERLHRTLKEATAAPPQASLAAQQRAFHRFRQEYNQERPHEALGGVPPARCYQASSRVYPSRLPEVEYGGEFVVRRVRHNGEIKWRGESFYISEALRGEPVGLRPLEEDHWQLYFSHLLLGVLDERLGRIVRLVEG